jgi:hypothetical protein
VFPGKDFHQIRDISMVFILEPTVGDASSELGARWFCRVKVGDTMLPENHLHKMALSPT